MVDTRRLNPVTHHLSQAGTDVELGADRAPFIRASRTLITKEGFHPSAYSFDGRLVHENLAALFAYRIAQLVPITFSFACDDYGFELLSPDAAPIEKALEAGLLGSAHLLHDITASLNAAELARRQFREIARARLQPTALLIPRPHRRGTRSHQIHRHRTAELQHE